MQVLEFSQNGPSRIRKTTRFENAVNGRFAKSNKLAAVGGAAWTNTSCNSTAGRRCSLLGLLLLCLGR